VQAIGAGVGEYELVLNEGLFDLLVGHCQIPDKVLPVAGSGGGLYDSQACSVVIGLDVRVDGILDEVGGELGCGQKRPDGRLAATFSEFKGSTQVLKVGNEDFDCFGVHVELRGENND